MNEARPTKAAARRSASGLRGLPTPRCLHSHETLETRMRGRRLVEQFACTNTSRCMLSRSGISSQGGSETRASTGFANFLVCIDRLSAGLGGSCYLYAAVGQRGGGDGLLSSPRQYSFSKALDTCSANSSSCPQVFHRKPDSSRHKGTGSAGACTRVRCSARRAPFQRDPAVAPARERRAGLPSQRRTAVRVARFPFSGQPALFLEFAD